MRIVFIDNFDSFTFNLVQQVQSIGAPYSVSVDVYLNNSSSTASIFELKADGVVISPGPGGPESAGISLDVIRYAHGKIPLLGVCLGHQAIAHLLGGKVIRNKNPMHGKTSEIHHNQKRLFSNLPTPMTGARYHSLLVERHSLPSEFYIDAHTSDNEIMAISHKTFPTFGVQFHPESFMTIGGDQLIANFLSLCAEHV